MAATTPRPLVTLCSWLRTGEVPAPPSPEAAEALVDAARTQRVAPLLYVALTRSPGWPASSIARLRALHHASFANGARQLELAGRLLESLARAGVRALPMKGVAVAERVYESVAERPMGDVDVLVLDGWEQAVRTARELGLDEGGRADHAWTFRDARGAVVELHHSVTSCPGLFPLDAEGVWERSAPANGLVARRPAAQDLIVHLALHAAFQHALILTLGQYLDFKRLLASELIEPDALRQAVDAAGAGPSVAASFAVADALVGLPLDEGLARWARSRMPRSLGRWIDQHLAEPTWFLPPRQATLARLRWGLSAGRRWALVRGTLAPTSPGWDPSLLERGRAAIARASGLASRWL